MLWPPTPGDIVISPSKYITNWFDVKLSWRGMRGVEVLAFPRDHVDHIIEQWVRERSDIDVSPMGVIARMSRLSRFLERSIEEVLARHGINESQFGVLAALRRAGRPYILSPTALYNSLLISSGAMTNRLERLTAGGLVKRIPDPNDGRSVLVALTPKGRKLVDEAVTAHTTNEHRLLATLTEGEKLLLADFLRRLLLQFEDHHPARGDGEVVPAKGAPEAPRPQAAGGRVGAPAS
jgi:DNA-binding MarR family transcriptional regulator